MFQKRKDERAHVSIDGEPNRIVMPDNHYPIYLIHCFINGYKARITVRAKSDRRAEALVREEYREQDVSISITGVFPVSKHEHIILSIIDESS